MHYLVSMKNLITPIIASFTEIFYLIKLTDIIFLDIAKAFYTVPHNEILLKLRRLGVCGDVWL